MEAAVHGLIFVFENTILMKDLLKESFISDMTGISFDILGLMVSKPVFEIVANDGKTVEKRLQIDIHSVKESLKKGELKSLSWFPGILNPSDGLTKGIINDNHPLWKIITKNKFSIPQQGWVTNEFKYFEKEKKSNVKS